MTAVTGPEPLPGVVTDPVVRTSAAVPAALSVTITNTASEPRVFSVTAVGVDASWLPRPSRSRPIRPGESIVAVLSVRPGEGTVAARYPLAITVQALDPATGQATSPTSLTQVDLVVDAPGQISVTLDPPDATAVYGKKLRVLLHNSGSRPETVYLEARSPHSTAIDIVRGPLEVPPGATVAVRARVNVTRPALFRRKARHAYTVTARSGGAPRFAEGSLTARPLFGPVGTKLFAVLAVVAVWVALGFLFIPKLADSVSKKQGAAKSTTTKSTTTSPSAGGKNGGKNGGSGGTGGGTDGGGNGGSGGSGGGAAGGGTGLPTSVQLNGTVTGNAPDGVAVRLSPTTLGSDAASGATPVGATTESARVGKIPGSAMATSTTSQAASDRSVTTGADGAWSFAKVPAVGYYVVQFSKPGYQTQRFVINAASAVATQPLKIALAPATGRLNGVVHSASGGVIGGASVIITDGANTITTSSDSTGASIGAWSVSGLSTPSTYIVSISKPGLGTQSQLVTLAAGGQGTVALTLRTGVATLTGHVTTLIGNHQVGLGGARVSATDGTVTRTATTVTTGNQKGTFTLPDLTLGRWSVTMEADGYQLQSRTVEIVAGRALATVNASLSSATASVSGVVLHAGRALVGAGLTLTNTTNTYKQTTDNHGGFSFTGVAPGVYSLTAQYFGMDPSVQTVKAVVGKTSHFATFNLKATSLTNTSTIVGYAGNAVSSGGGLGCVKDTSGLPLLGCWVGFRLVDADGASVLTKLTDAGTPAATSVEPTVSTGPTPYILSTVDGLAAGLYQLTISSQGFIPATVTVRVPRNQIAAAPQVNLFPANAIGGRINTIGSFNHDGAGGTNCVVAVPVGFKTSEFDISAFTCDAVSTDPAKTETPATIDALQTQCTNNGTATPAYGIVRDDGAYSITGLCDGRYSTYVVVQNAAYDQESVPPADQTVTHGQTQLYSPHVARKGVLALTAKALDPSTGASNPLTTATSLTLTCPAGQPSPTVTTNGSGQVKIFGFAAGTVDCQITTGGASPLTGTTGSVVLFDDNDSAATSTLSGALDPAYGRVVSTYAGGLNNVGNVVVTITAVTGYDGTDPITATQTITTAPNGCFAVIAPLPAGAVKSVPAPASGDCAGGVPTDNILEMPLTSRSVSAGVGSGLVTDSADAQDFTLGVVGSASVPRLSVRPTPVSTSGLTFSSDPAGEPLNGAKITLTSNNAAGSGTITAGVTGTGELTWLDGNIGQPNLAWPGQYTLKLHLDGFSDLTSTLACGLPTPHVPRLPGDDVSACTLSPATIAALGDLTGTVRSSPDGGLHPVVANASVILRSCGSSTSTCPAAPPQTSACPTVAGALTATTNSAGQFAFTGTVARYFLPLGNYQVIACASGLRTGTAPTVTITGGEQDMGNLDLDLLGGLRGIVTGSDNTGFVSGATVRLYSCVTGTCSSVFQTTTTDGAGTYEFTGPAGRYFMDVGDWKITVSSVGFGTLDKTIPIVSGDNSGSIELTAQGALNGTVGARTVDASPNTTPLAGATITIDRCVGGVCTSTPVDVHTATSTSSGEFSFASTSTPFVLTTGLWHIRITATGFVPYDDTITINSGANTPSVILDALGTLTGTVVGDSGTPPNPALPGASVTATFCPAGVCPAGPSASDQTVLADSSGNFAFTGSGTPYVLAHGAWQLTVSANGYSTAVVPVTIKTGVNTASATLTALGSLSGSISGVSNVTQQLSGATVTAKFCGTTPVAPCTGTTRTAVSDTSGNYTFTGSGTAFSLAVGYWQVTASAFGYTPASQFVPIVSGPTVQNLSLDVRHVTQNIGVLISGSTQLTKHAVVTLFRQDTPNTPIDTTLTGSMYVASDLIPTSYSVQVEGDSTPTGQSIFPTVTTLAVPLSDTGTVPDRTVPVSVVQNTVKGTIVGAAGKNATPTNLSGVTVELGTGASAGAFTVDDNVGGDPLVAVTKADGTFKLSGIPNGTYSVRINTTNPVEGYQPDFLSSAATVQFGFTQDFGSIALTRRSQQVTVKLTLPTGDTLPGIAAGDGILTNAGDSTWTMTGGGVITNVAGQVTWSFNDVPYGCWKFSAALPNLHNGTFSQTNAGDTGDTSLSCVGGSFPVRGDADGQPGSPTYALREDPLDLKLAVTSYDGAAPGAVQLSVTKSGASSSTYANAAFPTGSPATRIWLANGTYTIDVTVPAQLQAWPEVTSDVTMSGTSNPNQGSVTLVEATSDLTVKYSGTVASGKTYTVSLVCQNVPAQTLPNGCDTEGAVGSLTKKITTANASTGVKFTNIAPGAWTVHLTGPDPATTVDATSPVTLTAGVTTASVSLP